MNDLYHDIKIVFEGILAPDQFALLPEAISSVAMECKEEINTGEISFHVFLFRVKQRLQEDRDWSSYWENLDEG